ncbi:RNA polymerase sigma-70 factor [Chitinophaga alhagiae]|uniref:RNA polymerase sigma-70 factor n=1 Tax=Chitinophaga alhagiae TaxID=2203219 RepID=A0ABN5LRG0_9BACT|nr:RNA polymerase sigma-70 factor [Chitinophaga alhagiae]AWO01100.1 RNA polymerase sigma-70 factor [Chitinophaga alhagiae]
MSAYSFFTDNELYLLLVQDNEEAFTILYHRYWKRMLYKAVIKLQSHADAEEVVQDAFTDIWKSRHRIKIQNSFHTYIAAIIRYKVMAKMASNKREAAGYAEDVHTLHAEDNATEQWLSFNELRNEIERSVKALPEKCQLIFRMSRERGMSDKEIARYLNISPKTVEAHISRALKFLRIYINRFVYMLAFAATLLTRA